MDPGSYGIVTPFSLRNEQKESSPQKKWREDDGKAQAFDIQWRFSNQQTYVLRLHLRCCKGVQVWLIQGYASKWM